MRINPFIFGILILAIFMGTIFRLSGGWRLVGLR